MKASIRRLLAAVPLGLLVLCSSAFAQDEPTVTRLPNPMSIHTWFIIAAAGALLAWSLSYSLQLQKEALKRKKGREDLRQQKEHLLDKIAALEERRESGHVGEKQYKQELKELKFYLSRVLDKLGSLESQKAAKKS
jgi:hypothetical protein